MKVRKIQSMFFKMLNSDQKVTKSSVNEFEYAFSDGYRLFILPVKSVNFNMDRCTNFTDEDTVSKLIEMQPEDVEVKKTHDLKEAGNMFSKRIARKFKSKGEIPFTVWLNDDWLNYFENPVFYGSGPLNRVLIKENSRGVETIVGVILPIRVSDND
jgi:hypothetical protein